MDWYYIVYWTFVVLVCLKILFDYKSSNKAISFILIVIAVPLLGFLIYLFFGTNRRKKKLYDRKLKLNIEAYPDLRDRLSDMSSRTIENQKDKIGKFLSLARYNSRRPTLDNNKIDLLINGELKFPDLINSIKNAKHHIHIEYYTYENDEIGNTLGKVLMEKAAEGVEVRFIYDDVGSMNIRKDFVEQLRKAGVQAYPFYEIKLIYLANRLNYRNHRKIVVIDGKTGYIGGINVGDSYINGENKIPFWRDTHLKITGVAVMSLQHTFITDWNFCADDDLEINEHYFPLDLKEKDYGDQIVQIVDSGPDSAYPNIMYSMVQAILLSQEEVLITTPYFIPDNTFLDALMIAHLSGVKIKMLVPYKSDSRLVNLACQSYYEHVLEVGIEIYRYKKGFVHAKTMVCDNQVSIIGTSNLDSRSFDLNFEVNAIIYDAGLASEVKDSFYKDLKESEQLTLEDWKKRPTYRKLLEKIIQLFSPIL